MDKNIWKSWPCDILLYFEFNGKFENGPRKFKKVLKEVRFLSIFFKVTKTLDEKISAFHEAVKNLHLAIVKS